MNKVCNLLNIDWDFICNYPSYANSGTYDKKIINGNISHLKQIRDSLAIGEQINVSPKSIEETINKVRIQAHEKIEEDWSVSELRILSFYLTKLYGDSLAYYHALSLLERNWKDLFFNGLLFCLLYSWNMMKKEYRIKTSELLIQKLLNYTGTNKKYLQLKKYANLIEENGPLRMATLLVHKSENILNAPSFIGGMSSTISYSFYSDVIIYYFDKKNIDDLSIIEEVLSKHNLDRTKKLVFANLVEKAEKIGSELMQTQISKFANRVMGDISLSVTWMPFVGATEVEVAKLRNAKNLVNLWFTRKIIEVFFEVCVQDKSRKIFWLEYVNYIKDFRVVGSVSVKRKMQNDSRISNLFTKYFIETRSRVSQTAALVLCIKNKVIVEFSDLGALYVYNHGHSIINFISKGYKSVERVEDLKLTSLPMLVEVVNDYLGFYLQDEGRLHHKGEWQKRLNRWIDEKIMKSTTVDCLFSDVNDDKIFQEQPLPKEEMPSISEIKDLRNINLLNKDSIDILYETDIKYSIHSKWIYGERCRIVAGEEGFFLDLKNGKYAYLKDLNPGTVSTGCIWIKSSNKNSWNLIQHAYNGRILNVGFIKQTKDGVLYKEQMNEAKYKEIKYI